MDNQALEIKKMRTTQIIFQRNKKKKTRLSGNKTNWSLSNNKFVLILAK